MRDFLNKPCTFSSLRNLHSSLLCPNLLMSTDLLARADSSVANEVATYMKSTNGQQNALRSAQNRDQVSPFEFEVNFYCASSKIGASKGNDTTEN